LEDVQAFYNTYYQPKNAILVIAGNIEKNNALQLCEKYFTSTKNSDCIHHTFTEPIQTTATQKTIQEEVPLNAIYIAFKMCDRLHPDYYVADITSDILANGTSSRLHQRLVKEAKAFVDMDAYITASNDIGMFVFEGKVSEGYDVYHAEQLVWKEIEQIKQDLVPEKELQKCKNKVLTYQNFSESSLLNRAISLAYYELLGNANLINEEEQHYEAIQTTDIQRFAKATFDKEKSNTLYYLKKDYLTK